MFALETNRQSMKRVETDDWTGSPSKQKRFGAKTQCLVQMSTKTLLIELNVPLSGSLTINAFLTHVVILVANKFYT